MKYEQVVGSNEKEKKSLPVKSGFIRRAVEDLKELTSSEMEHELWVQ